MRDSQIISLVVVPFYICLHRFFLFLISKDLNKTRNKGRNPMDKATERPLYINYDNRERNSPRKPTKLEGKEERSLLNHKKKEREKRGL